MAEVGDGTGDGGPVAEGRPGEPAARVVVGFATVLRQAGVEVPPSCVIEFARALGHVGLQRRQHVYWAGRATLIQRPEDTGIYDRAFAAFFEQRASSAAQLEVPLTMLVDSQDRASDDEDAPDEAGPDPSSTVSLLYSPSEVLRHQDFAAYSEADWAEARLLLDRLRPVGLPRRSRRLEAVKHDRGVPDLGRTLRRALAADGEPLDRAWRAPSLRARRTVFLVDISGSMSEYARGLLRFAHAAVSARGAGLVEVFVLGTRLTRITRPLSWRDPDTALAEAGRSVEDWFGGTRLGDGLKAFNDRWGVRGMARGAVVVICSDGWDRGDPEALAAEMKRLRRVARRVVWVNPLRASPGYAPVARGMAAALPYVDDFVDGHSLASLEDLVGVIAGTGRDRRA